MTLTKLNEERDDLIKKKETIRHRKESFPWSREYLVVPDVPESEKPIQVSTAEVESDNKVEQHENSWSIAGNLAPAIISSTQLLG